MSFRTALDRETCRECGKQWGVSMTPREDVLCQECVQPRPWKNPVHYWQSRLWNFPWGIHVVRSPEWWDAQTSRNELKFAAELARDLEPKPGQLALSLAVGS